MPYFSLLLARCQFYLLTFLLPPQELLALVALTRLKMPASCFLCHVDVSEENLCRDCDQGLYACSDGHKKAHKGSKRIGKDSHEEVCWPFKVESKAVIGNVLVATRDVKATEIILEEYPAAFGHHAKSRPCCMECLLDTVDKQARCSNCNFPLCSTESCQRKTNHEAECDILQTLNAKDFEWDENCLALMAVLPIRVLNLKEKNPDMWQKVDLLMDHKETMKDDERSVWQSQVIDLIQQSRPGAWSSQDILRAIGIINTNGVSLGLIKGCALYPTFSFLSHNCIANARFQIHYDKRIKVTALMDIPKGTEITISYLPCHVGNTLRRLKIKKNWYFDCCCQRCSDPSELGTCTDAIKCKKCSKNDDHQHFMLPITALDTESDWQCLNCKENLNHKTVKAILEAMSDEANDARLLEIKAVEDKLEKYSQILHPNNFILQSLKKRCLDLYRLQPVPSSSEEELRNHLQKQIELGQDLLAIMDKLEPGFTLKRGRILRQLHLPTLQLAKMDLKSKKISLLEFTSITRNVIKKMNNAVKCLEDFDIFVASSGNFLPNKEAFDDDGLEICTTPEMLL